MKDNLNIEELFSEKLSQHESPVRADLWQGIQAQMTAQGVAGSSAIAAKGISVAAKWMIGIASSVVITGSAIYLTQQNETVQSKTNITEQTQTEEQTERSLKTIESNENKTTSDNQSNVKPLLSEQEYEQYENESYSTPEPLIVKERKPETPIGFTPVADPVFEKGTQPKDNETTALFNATDSEQKEVVGKISKLPNVISPNDDQINDYLILKCENLKEFSITIMNQRNEVVYTSNDINFKWYGDKDGIKLPVGTYYYFVTAIDEHNHKINKYNTLDIRY